MFGLSEETWQAITPYLMAAIVALLTALGAWARNREAWLKMKTLEWEALSKEVKNEVHQARVSSEGNRVLLEETVERTAKLERNSNGVNSKLQNIAITSAFNTGKLKGKLEQIGAVDQEELDKLENEFKSSLKNQPEPDDIK